MQKLLSILIFCFCFQFFLTAQLSNNKSNTHSNTKIKTIKVNSLKFKYFSSEIVQGKEELVTLVKNKLEKVKNVSKIEIIYYRNFPTITNWKEYLSLDRAKAIKDLIAKNISLKGVIVEAEDKLNKLNVNNLSNFINNTHLIEIKIYSSEVYPTVEPKREENKVVTTDSNQKTIKLYKVPMNLVEPDVVAVIIKNEKQEVVNKFSKEFKTRGKVDIEVPIDISKPGKYSITMIGVNRSMAKATVEIYQAKK